MQSEQNNVMQWVASLAISIACCAVLFIVFASTLLDNQKMMVGLQVKQDWYEAKIYSLENNINTLQREVIKAQMSSQPAVPATRIQAEPEQKLDKPVEQAPTPVAP